MLDLAKRFAGCLHRDDALTGSQCGVGIVSSIAMPPRSGPVLQQLNLRRGRRCAGAGLARLFRFPNDSSTGIDSTDMSRTDDANSTSRVRTDTYGDRDLVRCAQIVPAHFGAVGRPKTKPSCLSRAQPVRGRLADVVDGLARDATIANMDIVSTRSPNGNFQRA